MTPKPNHLASAITATAVIILGGYFLFVKQKNVAPLPAGEQEYSSYSSKKFGFMVQYPKSWHPEECLYNEDMLVAFGDKPKLVVCASDSTPESYIEMGVSKERDYTAKEYAEESVKWLTDGMMKNVTIGETPAFRIEGLTQGNEEFGVPFGARHITTTFSKNGKIYSISYTERDGQDHRADYEAILKSFSFISL